MKARELRIGNIVLDEYLEEVYIIAIFKERLKVSYSGDDDESTKYLDISEIDPLLITPELLKKAGFKKTKSSYEEAETYDFYKGIIYLDMANNSMKVNGVYALSFIPEYFHQLQNLYFDLTGEEITI